MKNIKILFGICLLGLSIGCQKNDDRAPMEIALQNEPPISFDLVDIPDETIGVDVLPVLSWQSAENQKGSAVTYDLYLDTQVNPLTLYESNIEETSFALTQRLQLLTDYYWKVVAKDVEGRKSESVIHKFTTRNLNFTPDPVTASAEFLKRDRHSSVVFDEKMWVIGGFFDGERKNDVWHSSDGDTWTMATASAQFSERTGQTALVFDDKIWIIGGFDGEMNNDVWYSSDGVDWAQATASAEFTQRSGHTSVVFDDKMWVIGGAEGDFQYRKDVWYSSNGIDWIEATESADFSAGTGQTATAFDDKIWIIGGSVPGESSNEIWYSSDGIEWVQTTTNAVFSARSSHTSLVFANNLWVIGGRDDQSVRKSDMWYSSNGSHWTQATEAAPFSGRQNHTSLVFNNKLWVIAGLTTNGFDEDVWVMD